MTDFPMQVRVIESRVSDHIDDVRFRKGDDLAVGHRNQTYPEFVWCATEDGRAGWAPEEILRITGLHEAVALRDYSANHLTVGHGELLEAFEQIGDWLRCRNASGQEGWVRADSVRPAAED